MGIITSRKPGRKHRAWLYTTTIAAGLVVALALFLARNLGQHNEAVAMPEAFDTDACVRVREIGRVYRIRQESKDTSIIWFVSAQGVRRLDTRTMEWTRYGLDHDLPSEEVFDICFANDTPWVATDKGIAWFNATKNRFVQVPVPLQYANKRVFAIEYFKNWGVLFSIESGEFFWIKAEGTEPELLVLDSIETGSQITCLRTIGEQLYIGIEGRRLLRLDATDTSISQAKAIAFDRQARRRSLIWDVMVRNKQLWVATSDDGVWRTKANSDTLSEVVSFPGIGAFTLCAETDGLWAGTPFGLWRYHDPGDVWIQFVHPQEKRPTDFAVTTCLLLDNLLWYGSSNLGAGFVRTNSIEWQPLRAGLSNSNVAALCVDKENLWCAYGYQGGYIDRFSSSDVQYKRNYNYNDGVSDPQVQTILSRENRLYFGGFTDFGYLDRKSGVYRWFNSRRGLPHEDICQVLFIDSSNALLASLFGVVRYDASVDTFGVFKSTQPFRVTSLCTLGDTLWYGTLSDGVKAIRISQDREIIHTMNKADRIAGLGKLTLADSSTCLVAASRGSGVFLLHLRDNSVQPESLGISDSLLPGSFSSFDNNVLSMLVIDNLLFLGTREAGCLIYNPAKNKWSRLMRSDGLVSNQVRSFAADEKQIWIGCFGGVTRFEKKYLNSKYFLQ